MADSRSYQYFDIAKPTLPYKSYTSPVDETPHFVMGSQNVMASQIGYLEKRPGFSVSVGTFPSGTCNRIFGWRRWSGSFFTMLCVLDGGFSKVYKKQIGTDADFVLIWTSTSAVPFDFVVSDNFCFFGNETDMRKYDGTLVTKWGCDAPPNAPEVILETGTLPPGMSISGNVLSGTPTSVGTSQVTFTVTDSVGATATQTFNFTVNPQVLTINTIPNLVAMTKGSASSQTFTASFGVPAYTWSLFSGTIPAGMSLSSSGVLSGTPTASGPFAFAVKVTDASANTAVQAYSLYVQDPAALALSPASPLPDAVVGTAYTETITASGGTGPYGFSVFPAANLLAVGGNFPTTPQGINFTPATPDFNLAGTPSIPGTYNFRVLVTDAASNSLMTPYVLTVEPTILTILNQSLQDAVQGVAYTQTIVVGGGTAPYTYDFTAGTLDGQTGYIYGYSYTTIYGHESNVSPLSDSTGIFTAQDPTVQLIASSDPQVNGINLYRTTDGGVADPAIMRLVIALPNVNQTYQDSTQDMFLGTQSGPGFLINTPPTPTRGFVWSNGRIYGQVDNKTFYSGLEEISNGIPEEAWPSGTDGNFYAWASQVGGMAVTQNGVDIAMSEQFWQISGDSLDTFRKFLLLEKAGVGSPTCINAIGNSVQWVDSAKQIWSSSLGEIGEPIRLDLASIQPDSTYIGYHKSGNFNWIYVLDALNGRLLLYDLDTDQWYPPWTVAASAIWSGETSLGQLNLLAAFGNTIYQLTPNTYTDALNTYEDDIKSNLIPVSSGRTTTARDKKEPRQLEEIMFEQSTTDFHGVYPAFLGFIGDSDPVSSTFDEWQDMTPYNSTPDFIPVRRTIKQFIFRTDSDAIPCIRGAFWIQFAPSETPWKILSLTVDWIGA